LVCLIAKGVTGGYFLQGEYVSEQYATGILSNQVNQTSIVFVQANGGKELARSGVTNPL